MRTGHSLTVCCSLLPGGVCLVPGGVSAPGGVVPGEGGLVMGGVCSGGCLFRGGWVGCLVPGGYPSMHWGRHPSPPVDRYTLVKTLPWPNFVAAGNNSTCSYKTAITCPSLSAPSNGRVQISSGNGYNSVATYTCNTGYHLSGSSRRTCQISRQWGGSQPTCTSKFSHTRKKRKKDFITVIH